MLTVRPQAIPPVSPEFGAAIEVPEGVTLWVRKRCKMRPAQIIGNTVSCDGQPVGVLDLVIVLYNDESLRKDAERVANWVEKMSTRITISSTTGPKSRLSINDLWFKPRPCYAIREQS